jgi:diguanylate cyclase (GGDEF)-like protein
MDAIQAVMWKHMAQVVGERDAWVTIATGGRVQVLFDTSGTVGPAFEAVTRTVVDADHPARTDGTPVREDGWCCFPMLAGGSVVGVLGVSERQAAMSPEAWRVLAAASAMLGIALRNVQLFAELRETAVTDGLTGCITRAQMIDVLGAELRRSRRTGSPLALLMIDLDGFKTLNDTQGHVAGDAALSAIGTRFREVLRHSDVRCRYGGDEFLVLLPDTPIGGALKVAENLRHEVEALRIGAASGFVVSCSIGVAAAVPGELDPVLIIHRADNALYRAKRGGRNQAAMYDPAYELLAPMPSRAGVLPMAKTA